MEYINHKEYIDDLIATSVGVDPLAMYYVQQKMDSLIHGNVKDLKEKDPIQEDYIDGLITTSVGVEPMAMYYVQQRMNSLINGKIDDLTEKDAMMAACVDEIIEGIDQSTNIGNTPHQLEPAKNKVQQGFVWFECPVDQWFDSQPELKNALDSLPEAVNKQDDYVWFAGSLDESIISQIDARLPGKHMQKVDKNHTPQDYVWFESNLDQWFYSNPDLRFAIEQLSDTVKNVKDDDSDKVARRNKVA